MTRFGYPFVYEYDGIHGFLKLGMQIRRYYIKWFATENYDHVRDAIPIISNLVGWTWRKLFGERAFDYDVLDPVAYRVIFKFIDHKLPFQYSFAHYLRITIRWELIRYMYKKFIPFEGDRSVRSFNYRPFDAATDTEHRIFVDDLKDLILLHLGTSTRLDPDERQACCYIGEALIKASLPSPLVLRDKYGIPYPKQQFYLDFTKVNIRRQLYKVREDVPYLYGNERRSFVSMLELTDEEKKEDEENTEAFF